MSSVPDPDDPNSNSQRLPPPPNPIPQVTPSDEESFMTLISGISDEPRFASAVLHTLTTGQDAPGFASRPNSPLKRRRVALPPESDQFSTAFEYSSPMTPIVRLLSFDLRRRILNFFDWQFGFNMFQFRIRPEKPDEHDGYVLCHRGKRITLSEYIRILCGYFVSDIVRYPFLVFGKIVLIMNEHRATPVEEPSRLNSAPTRNGKVNILGYLPLNWPIRDVTLEGGGWSMDTIAWDKFQECMNMNRLRTDADAVSSGSGEGEILRSAARGRVESLSFVSTSGLNRDALLLLMDVFGANEGRLRNVDFFPAFPWMVGDEEIMKRIRKLRSLRLDIRDGTFVDELLRVPTCLSCIALHQSPMSGHEIALKLPQLPVERLRKNRQLKRVFLTALPTYEALFRARRFHLLFFMTTISGGTSQAIPLEYFVLLLCRPSRIRSFCGKVVQHVETPLSMLQEYRTRQSCLRRLDIEYDGFSDFGCLPRLPLLQHLDLSRNHSPGVLYGHLLEIPDLKTLCVSRVSLVQAETLTKFENIHTLKCNDVSDPQVLSLILSMPVTRMILSCSRVRSIMNLFSPAEFSLDVTSLAPLRGNAALRFLEFRWIRLARECFPFFVQQTGVMEVSFLHVVEYEDVKMEVGKIVDWTWTREKGRI